MISGGRKLYRVEADDYQLDVVMDDKREYILGLDDFAKRTLANRMRAAMDRLVLSAIYGLETGP